MKQYLDLLRNVLKKGVRQQNRTGIEAITLPGALLQFDLREGFPIVTTKRLVFNGMVGELLSFFRGYTNAEDFEKLGCKFWRQNADENQQWLDNPNRKGPGDLGRIYGAQWTDWASYHKAEHYSAELGRDLYVRDSINQLDAALWKLLSNPYDRRIIINAWRPDEFDNMALPPCHCMYQFSADVTNKTLHLCMYQRSCDSFLGVPVNIASSALFLSIMSALTGYTAGTFNHFLADAHIYVNHLDQVEEQLSREPYELPRLLLSDEIRPISTAEYMPGRFALIEPEHIAFSPFYPYKSHPAISAPMAV